MARFQFKNRKNNGLIFFISFMVMGEAAIAAPLPQWANAPAVTPVAQLSLQESILRAFARNPGVTQQAAQIGIGEAQIDEAKSAWYPHVGLTGNAGPSRQTDSSGRLDNNVSYGITLTQLVYDFGKTNNDINLQTAARDSYRFKLMATLTDVAEKTATAYMEVSRYQALCALSDCAKPASSRPRAPVQFAYATDARCSTSSFACSTCEAEIFCCPSACCTWAETAPP